MLPHWHTIVSDALVIVSINGMVAEACSDYFEGYKLNRCIGFLDFSMVKIFGVVINAKSDGSVGY